MEPVPIQISEMFGLVNAYSLNGVLLNFYLMHLKIAMNISFRISEGLDQRGSD